MPKLQKQLVMNCLYIRRDLYMFVSSNYLKFTNHKLDILHERRVDYTHKDLDAPSSYCPQLCNGEIFLIDENSCYLFTFDQIQKIADVHLMNISSLNNKLIRSTCFWNTKYFLYKNSTFRKISIPNEGYLMSWEGITIIIRKSDNTISKLNEDLTTTKICDIKRGEICSAYF